MTEAGFKAGSSSNAIMSDLGGLWLLEVVLKQFREDNELQSIQNAQRRKYKIINSILDK